MTHYQTSTQFSSPSRKSIAKTSRAAFYYLWSCYSFFHPLLYWNLSHLLSLSLNRRRVYRQNSVSRGMGSRSSSIYNDVSGMRGSFSLGLFSPVYLRVRQLTVPQIKLSSVFPAMRSVGSSAASLFAFALSVSAHSIFQVCK